MLSRDGQLLLASVIVTVTRHPQASDQAPNQPRAEVSQ